MQPSTRIHRRLGNRSVTRCRATLVVCRASTTSWKAPVQPSLTRRFDISYTTRSYDVDARDLQLLLQAACQHRKHQHEDDSSWHIDHLFSHWEDSDCAENLQRLKQVLDRSSFVAAAYARLEDLYPETPASTSNTGGWSWSGGGTRGRQLVGFARAACDKALVATLHDIVVHPAVQNTGVGRRLVGSLVASINGRGISDIGCCTPATAAPFFEACSFELDREGAVPMVLRPGAQQQLLEEGADAVGKVDLARRPALQQLLLRAAENPDSLRQRMGFLW